MSVLPCVRTHLATRLAAAALAASALAATLLLVPLTPAPPAGAATVVSSGIELHSVNPHVTDAALSSPAPGNFHEWARPAAAAEGNGKLVIFLGGSGSITSLYDDITARAANLGYHAINLNYINTTSAGSSCAAPPAPETPDSCYAQFRGETLFGTGPSFSQGADLPSVPSFNEATLDVGREDSVVNRAIQLLDWLRTNDPAGGWGPYLRSSPTSPYTGALPGAGGSTVQPLTIDWPNSVLVGHSQGGGSAAFLGKYEPARRVVSLSAPQDNVVGTPASWITSAPFTTPTTRYWGLRDETTSGAGEGVFGDFVANNWSAFGGTGFGGPESSATYAFSATATNLVPASAQRLRLDYSGQALTSLSRHNATAVDGAAPASVDRDQGSPTSNANPTTSAWDVVLTGNFATGA